MAFLRLLDATQFERPLAHSERIPRQLGGFQHIAQTDQSGCPLATFAGEGCSKDGEESAKQNHRKEDDSLLTEEGELLLVAFPRSSDLELCLNLYQINLEVYVLPLCRFINARRRILQPMLDSSCSETPKTKKKTAQNRPVQRFWPDSIASGVAQHQTNELTMSDGAVVTITAPVNMNVDSLQSLSSDGTTLAVQQVMMAGQSEDESVDSTEDDGTDLSTTNISGLVLDNSDSLQ
ncbi:homeobox protein PKNOX1-like [Protobothrops mucrosquamatus]|uniref:homeobox protein PKNOX1-like n=1 Tax=Protobothrops mucrosquamatus TaxID=103944 RepID=UPI0007756415|nr:homeobox protein PKNOX1-like [Protobothrops mucrosquamatus]